MQSIVGVHAHVTSPCPPSLSQRAPRPRAPVRTPSNRHLHARSASLYLACAPYTRVGSRSCAGPAMATQAVADTISSWTGGYTLSSLCSSSDALAASAGGAASGSAADLSCDPSSPCRLSGAAGSDTPPGSDDDDSVAFGSPDDDPAHWPRFRAVWAGEADVTKDAALRRWKGHKRWRAINDMDTVLSRPQTNFSFFKAAYPHAFHKRSKDGSILHLERGDRFAHLVTTATAAGLTAADAAMHTACLNEYLATVLDARPYPGGRVIRIVDCSDLSLWDMSSTGVVAFARGFGSVIGPHYPERSSRVFVVNTPASFATVFHLISGVFTRRLLDKVSVYSVADAAAAAEALREVVDPECLPAQYGGTCSCAGGCFRGAPEEQRLWDLVERVTPQETRLPVPSTADE